MDRRCLPLLLLLVAAACSGDPDTGDPDSGAFADLGADVGDIIWDGGDAGEAGVETDIGPVGPIVETSSGALRGESSGPVAVFRGVPFAAPPTGENRWRSPRPAESWSGIRDATVFGPVCPQLGAWSEEPPRCSECDTTECRAYCQSEDCLYLNVWTPQTEGSRPVMVWLHGGSYISGAGSLYDGRFLAERGDVVVVTVNYRLGALSQLAHPDAADPGNYGLLDQIEALRWVRSEIASFGGDPANVTVFGESAGGDSVCQLVTSPLAGGLFERAIMQSGHCASTMRPEQGSLELCPDLPSECPELDAIEENEWWSCLSARCLSERLADALGCAGDRELECMREERAEAVVRALPESIGFDAGGVLWTRYVDGDAIPAAPAARLQSGDVNDVDFALGTTADEATLFFFPGEAPVQTAAQFDAAIAAWGECSDELTAAYPDAESDPVGTYLELLGDQWYVCSTNLAARWASEHLTVRLYQWTHVPWLGAQDLGLSYRLGAYHSSELPYVFGNLASPRTSTTCTPDPNGDWRCCDALDRCFEPLDLELSDTLIGYWTRFARTGEPAGWPPYTAADPEHLILRPSIGTGPEPRADRCAVWEGVWSATYANTDYCQ